MCIVVNVYIEEKKGGVALLGYPPYVNSVPQWEQLQFFKMAIQTIPWLSYAHP